MICGGVIWGVHFRSLEFLLVDFGTEMSVVMWCIGSIIDIGEKNPQSILGPPPPSEQERRIGILYNWRSREILLL
jgi:hypothetical protein